VSDRPVLALFAFVRLVLRVCPSTVASNENHHCLPLLFIMNVCSTNHQCELTNTKQTTTMNEKNPADEDKETCTVGAETATTSNTVPRPTNRSASTVVESPTTTGIATTEARTTSPTGSSSKNSNTCSKKTGGGGGPKQTKRMDESAHTFAANAASVSNHHTRISTETMITDALSDVRVHYHIEAKELGHGHYGIVRKCMHRSSQEWYAIKSIRKSKVSKIEVLKREIEILKEVDHPNIIKLIEVYEDERYLHLITEICTGGELFDRIIAKTQSAEGHFSEHDAAALVRDILDAIRYCHDEKGIVHRGT
jgi:hypothetical protein